MSGLKAWIPNKDSNHFFGVNRSSPARRFLRNVLICCLKDFEKFQKFDLPKLYKTVVGRRKYGNIELKYDYYCDPDRAYLIDSLGVVHTLVIKE